METPGGPQKPLACRRAQSLDRPQAPRKDSGSGNCQCLSFSTAPCRRPLRRTSSDGARHSGIPAQSAEAQGTVTTALTLEGMRGLLPSEQRPQQDAKKHKAQRRAQQGWLKAVLNFFLRTGPEEPREKASKRPKGKEEPSEPPDGPGEPALRTRARDKKASRKRHSHRKHDAEDPEAGLPRTEAASTEEADPGPAGRGGHGHDSFLHPSLPIEVGGAGFSGVSPQAAGAQPEEHLRKPDQDAVIQRIVELLKKVGDQWEEEQQLQVPRLEVALQNPSPVCKRKSQERKASLKRAFSLKKYGPGPEESRRAGAADVPSAEARPPKKSSFLPMCVGSHRSSISSSPGLEGPEVHEALSADGEGPSPSEPPTHARCQGPVEELPLDGASESNKFFQKILALLQDAEEQEGEQQPQVQEVEVAVENPAPVCRKKSQEKKSSLRRAFSHKKHSSKEPRRAGTVPEAGTPKRPSYLPLCVGGHRSSISSSSDPEHSEFQEPLAAEGFPAASSQTRSHTPEGGALPEDTCESKEGIICTLVELLQEVDGELGDQIGRHPSFKSFFYEFSDSTLRKLVATLRRRKTHSPGGARSLAQRPSPYAFGLVHKFAGSHSRTICSLMGSRGHCVQHNFTQFPSREAQPNMPSPECQSPD
uniref:protein BNIP5 isoform X1 n=1 Tax=Ictidomys tridecemlineatus TaxID=43179 RepID=UPI001A9E8542|nr:protein BNIP5 isoform X1 [Ictidomys tridecemlineatus]